MVMNKENYIYGRYNDQLKIVVICPNYINIL